MLKVLEVGFAKLINSGAIQRFLADDTLVEDVWFSVHGHEWLLQLVDTRHSRTAAHQYRLTLYQGSSRKVCAADTKVSSLLHMIGEDKLCPISGYHGYTVTPDELLSTIGLWHGNLWNINPLIDTLVDNPEYIERLSGMIHITKYNVERIVSCEPLVKAIRYSRYCAPIRHTVASPGAWMYEYPQLFNSLAHRRSWMPIPATQVDRWGNPLDQYVADRDDPVDYQIY